MTVLNILHAKITSVFFILPLKALSILKSSTFQTPPSLSMSHPSYRPISVKKGAGHAIINTVHFLSSFKGISISMSKAAASAREWFLSIVSANLSKVIRDLTLTTKECEYAISNAYLNTAVIHPLFLFSFSLWMLVYFWCHSNLQGCYLKFLVRFPGLLFITPTLYTN